MAEDCSQCEPEGNECSIGTMHFIKCNATGKKWAVPDNLLDKQVADSDQKFVRLPSAAYGLCNLLHHGRLAESKPSLKHSNGLKELFDKRLAMQQPSADLFDEDLPMRPKKKVKKKESDTNEILELQLGHPFGILQVKQPTRADEDLHIVFDNANVTAFCTFMLEKGAQSVEPSRRSYKKANK